MTIMVPDQGEVLALKALLNHTAGQDLKLRLFKNNYTPTDADTEADYTEATFSGYAAITLTGASWTVTPGDPSSAVYAAQTFTCSLTGATNNIYGYYLTQTTSGKLIWSERFSDGPYAITNTGDLITITPTITGEHG